MVLKVQFEWDIEKFRELCASKKVGEYELSPIFSASSDRNAVYWRIYLFPNGNIEENSEYVSIFVRVIAGMEKTQTLLTFKILNLNNCVVYEKTPTDSHLFYNCANFVGWSQFIEREEIFKNFYNSSQDNLKICCDLKLSKKKYNFEAETNKLFSLECLSKNFYELYKSEKYTDVNLICKDRTFKVHKIILVSRSPVFRAMFEHDMKESSTNIVNIYDIEPKAFEKFLEYMYTGNTNVTFAEVESLLEASEKYQLLDAKELCLAVLKANISITKAVEILLTADKFNLFSLKKIVLKFINDNASQVLESDGWSSMLTRPDLMNMILRFICSVE